MKNLLLLTLFLMLFSCKESKKELVEVKQVSNEFILEFLNEILSDSTETRYFRNEIRMISNFAPMVRDTDFFYMDLEDKKFNSLVDYKADLLNTKDTTFIKNQLNNNPKLNLDFLSNYGFVIFDYKKYFDDQMGIVSIDKKIQIENVKNGFNIDSELLMIEKPTFNKELNLAYIRFKNGSNGKKVLFEKKNGKWKLLKEISTWNEHY
ncbi:hypothetical protein [uncultured Flavobacterium sp.]|uniref:hypothetical protein n=1 Tax=uncultured Flavobacterium sp. TaxID=165435 RepID=UPI0030EF780E|tara:strand:- start:1046 stop:1666 length:621 start_codon:yes stop_codon:yes gene_type:complete